MLEAHGSVAEIAFAVGIQGAVVTLDAILVAHEEVIGVGIDYQVVGPSKGVVSSLQGVVMVGFDQGILFAIGKDGWQGGGIVDIEDG